MLLNRKVLLIIFTMLMLGACTNQPLTKKVTVGWPDISYETKPWARWWWMGSSVDTANLASVMEKYQAAGLGGLELTTIYGVKGMEDDFIDFMSPKWMEMLEYTLKKADKLNMGVDMALASGWPFGGPWVSPEDACRNIEIKTYKVPKGKTIDEKIAMTQQTIMRAVGHRTTFEQLSDPIGTNDSLQYYAFDQVRFPRQLPLKAIVAYPESGGETIDLTNKLTDKGILNWTADNDNYTLIAAFAGWHGKMVERAGPGGEGDVIDHFSLEAITNYLQHFDKKAKGYDLSHLRAFFNDSYEVDDARGEGNFTNDFFEAFKLKRGYDLKLHLPDYIGLKGEEAKNRVVCDYRETIAELLLENYTIPWQQWAADKGKAIRNQSHGSPANILDLYAASDIPETEGTDLVNIKFASSASHITNKKLTGAEAATWLDEHFLATLADSKENIDRYLIGGVNHIVYHGTTYSPNSEGWPGRMFYASVNYAPSNPFWKDFDALNQYVTRAQSFLQRGTVDNDILVYYPIYDAWMEPGRRSLQHFHGTEHDTKVFELATKLIEKGYSFDFISDKQLTQTQCNKNFIVTENGSAYKTILVPETEYIPLATFKQLIDLAKNGATILFSHKFPEKVPGLNQFEEQDSELKTLIQSLQSGTSSSVEHTYSIGKGKVVVAENTAFLLNQTDVKNETLVNHKLSFIRLNDGDGKNYFVTNWSGEDISDSVTLNTKASSVVRYNPMTGKYGQLASSITDNNVKVYLNLKNGESCFLQCFNYQVDVDEYEQSIPIEEKMLTLNNWSLEFIQGGPEFPKSIDKARLISWTQLEDPVSKWFSGTASYKTSFSRPEGKYHSIVINLGEVHESAEIILNGRAIETLIGPEYTVEIPSDIILDQNNLEILVTNLMANRMIYMDKNNLPYRNFYNINFSARKRENVGPDGKFTAINWEPIISGLIGPVTLTPTTIK